MFNPCGIILLVTSLLVLLCCSCSAIIVNDYFVYVGDVLYEDDNNTVSEILLSPHFERKKFIRCFVHCLEDRRCNAVEICSNVTNDKCRLSKGRKHTSGTLTKLVCKRYMMMDLCGIGGYFDRNSGQCVYDDCMSCDCVGTYTRTSGLYEITIGGDRKLVYCSFEASLSWTVVQRRRDGSENFYRNWAEYELGFGLPSAEVWLGNKYIHHLTTSGHNILRIELEDKLGNKRYAEYNSFTVADVTDNYRIQVAGYTGDAGDSFSGTCSTCNNDMPFSTFDRENDNAPDDKYYGHCAEWTKSGWWFNACHRSNLNGIYGVDNYAQGINWDTWTGFYYSLKASTIKIRKN